MLPSWLQVIIGIAAAITASGVIYTKALRPFVHSVELLNDIREDLGQQPDVFAVLNDLAKQFRTNNGSSLRDVVDRLEEASKANSVAIEATRVTLESAKVLAEADRRTAARLEQILNVVLAKSSAAAVLAAGVATDLEDAHVRAEERTATAAPGEAADAAMRRPAEQETPQ